MFETTAPRFVCGSKPWYPQYPEITDEWMVKNPNMVINRVWPIPKYVCFLGPERLQGSPSDVAKVG